VPDRLLITAASAAYGDALLAFLGSVSLNWPSAPDVLVSDLGLEDRTRDALRDAGIQVKEVPPFVGHWRRHFTWKFWCWNDAPARDVFYLDAGITVLRPLDEVYDALASLHYFVVPTYHSLPTTASEAACRGCGVDASFRDGKMTMAGGIFGFRKEGVMKQVLEEGLAVASDEEHVAATEPMHRHDQAILSLLLYKHLKHPLLADGITYGGWLSPEQTPIQGIWAHRKRLAPADAAHFAAHAGRPGAPHMPAPPPEPPLADRVGGALHRVRRRVQRMGPEIYDGVRD
jgi:hypothetical protein